MARRRTLLGLIAAVLALFYAAGSTTAALASALPNVSMPMKSDCTGQHKAPDCARSCATMCAAVTPEIVEITPPAVADTLSYWVRATPIAARHGGPEPPPPRLAQAVRRSNNFQWRQS